MLKGKTALITGASRGIGRAIAEKFISQGANVAAIYFGSEQKAKELLAYAESEEGSVKIYKCNVADFSECGETVAAVIKDFGGIDILVNNAGITRDGLLMSMSEADFDDVISANLKGAFNMTRHACRNFVKRKYGKIINISSVAGIMGNAGQANYAAAKAGIIGLTKSTAKELASRNICCNAIAPGFIKTDMTESFWDNEKITESIPSRRMGTPEEVAALAAFLADSVSDYITGEVIRIDGGLAM